MARFQIYFEGSFQKTSWCLRCEMWVKGRNRELFKFFYLYISFLSFLKILLKCSFFLQCCVNFFYTAKWLRYRYIYILFHILFHYGLSQDIEYSSLCYTVGPCCLSILYIIVCLCPSQTPIPSLPYPCPPWQPQVCSLYLWVCFCFVDMLICIVF